MSNTLARHALRIALIVCIATPAWAGGAGLYEIGTPDMGVAAAGRAAAANDASTTFGNPAGMTRLDGFQVVGGLAIFQVQTFFDPQRPPSDVSGGAGGNAGGFSPLPSWGGWSPLTGLYAVYSLRDDLKLGFSVNSTLAASLDYDPNWTGRYFVQRADLLTMNFNPTIAYRVLPWLSLGAGFTIQYAKLVQKAAINNFLNAVGDGRIILHDADVGFGGNFGVLAEPSSTTRFGLTYRSPVHQDFNDIASVSNLGPGLRALLEARGLLGHKVDMSLTVPQEVMLSAYHQLTPAVTLLANFDWQDWSQFGRPQLTVSGTSLTVNQQYQDTFGMAVGSEIRVADPWLLSLGFAYDTSAVDDAHRTASFNVDNQYRWALGLQYDWSNALTFGVAYEFLWLGSSPINQSSPIAGTLKGDYSTNHVNFVNFTVNARL
jgi:long-chain fatty acid transport protein